jgi:hypothetical protein
VLLRARPYYLRLSFAFASLALMSFFGAATGFQRRAAGLLRTLCRLLSSSLTVELIEKSRVYDALISYSDESKGLS